MNFKSILWLPLLCLGACSSTQELPAGIGTGTDDLKRSPCTKEGEICKKEPFYTNGHWVN